MAQEPQPQRRERRLEAKDVEAIFRRGGLVGGWRAYRPGRQCEAMGGVMNRSSRRHLPATVAILILGSAIGGNGNTIIARTASTPMGTPMPVRSMSRIVGMVAVVVAGVVAMS